MKNITKIFAIALVALGFSATSFAQSIATASSTAELVTPLKITKTSDLDYGVLASSTTAGSVSMSATGAVTPSGGAYVIGGTTTTAIFNVTGATDESISISYPSSILLTGQNTAGTLTLGTIVSNKGTSTTLVGGSINVAFSSVLTIPANTVADIYSNADDLEVTVNYN